MNKYSKNKRALFAVICISCEILIIVLAGMLQHRRLNYNYNLRINAICNELADKYPDMNVNDVIHILNEDSLGLNSQENRLDDYGIDIRKSSAIAENNRLFAIYLVVDIVIATVISFFIFIVMNRVFINWDRRLEEIADDLARINAGDYSYDMNTGEEGKIAILENEIYKSAIRCREAAENSRKDKEHLKESLSDISHQLKTPITSLLINLDNLEDYPELPVEKRLKLISNAKRDTNKINQMVQMLLKLSRLEADVIEFEKREVSISEIIKKSAENVLALCDLKGIDLIFNDKVITGDNIEEVCEDEAKAMIVCDPYWEVEALSNIMKNGAEHAGSKMVVSFCEYAIYTEIVVENDGDAISPEEAKNIFTRYYRGETAVVDSVGIGLSLADSIVRRDGGYIMAEAYEREGENGTRFILRYMR